MARALIVALAILSMPSGLNSDAIVITRAMLASTVSEIFIHDDSVVVELEIGLEDVSAFVNLLPDDLHAELGFDPEPWSERLIRFVREDFVIREGGDQPLFGYLRTLELRQRIRRDEITGEPLPTDPDSAETVISARLTYPTSGRPPVLYFSAPGTEAGAPEASGGFMTYHRGVPVNDFRYLGAHERINLDWDDPWYSGFENRNLRRQFYAPISAYLYVEPYEVRKEVVFRPRDLQQWVDLGLEGVDTIRVAQQEEVMQRAVEFLRSRNPVTIDGTVDDGIDLLYGDGRPDEELTVGGNDLLFGGGEGDTLDGGHGNDYLDAGLGNDTAVTGGPGDDIVRGGGGDDLLHGNGGIDQVYGDGGSDHLFGDAGDANGNQAGQRLLGGEGIDYLFANGCTDFAPVIERVHACFDGAFEPRRLFHGRGRCYPDYMDVVVDWFPPYIIVGAFGEDLGEASRNRLLDALAGLPGVEGVLLQQRQGRTTHAEVARGEVPEQFTVSESLQAMVETMSPLIDSKGQKLEFAVSMDNALVKLDRRRIGQVLMNLVGNASKYSPPDTVVTVDVLQKADQILITVSDEGQGIAEEDQPELFTPFFRVNSELTRTEPGTGLGLALVKKITELHGGTVSVESAPGEGSKFTVALKAASDAKAA